MEVIRFGGGLTTRHFKSSGRSLQAPNCRHNTSASCRVDSSGIFIDKPLMCWRRCERVIGGRERGREEGRTRKRKGDRMRERGREKEYSSSNSPSSPPYLQDITEVMGWVKEFAFFGFQYGQSNEQRVVRREIVSPDQLIVEQQTIHVTQQQQQQQKQNNRPPTI